MLYQIRFYVAIAFGAVAFLATSFANAQEPGDESGVKQWQVAVLDIAKVFEKHPSFNQEMKKIKEGIEEAGLFSKDQDSDGVEAGEVAKRSRLLQKAMLENEATLYSKTYDEVQLVVSQLAKQHNIRLVIRSESANNHRGNRGFTESNADVLKRINRSVIYQDKLDLTNMVIQELEKRSAKASPKSRVSSTEVELDGKCEKCGHPFHHSSESSDD